MIRLAAAAVFLFVLTGAGPAPTPQKLSAQSHAAQAGSPLARLRALATPQRLAQVQCPPPDQGESFCGTYGNDCIYCPSARPHACLSLNMCYETLTDAQAACGNEWVVCSRPVG